MRPTLHTCRRRAGTLRADATPTHGSPGTDALLSDPPGDGPTRPPWTATGGEAKARKTAPGRAGLCRPAAVSRCPHGRPTCTGFTWQWIARLSGARWSVQAPPRCRHGVRSRAQHGCPGGRRPSRSPRAVCNLQVPTPWHGRPPMGTTPGAPPGTGGRPGVLPAPRPTDDAANKQESSHGWGPRDLGTRG
jgi:hypothetical protein